MGLHGLICSCFAAPKNDSDVLPEVTQGLPVEVVSAGNAAKQTEEMPPANEAAPAVNGCVAKDSVNSIADDQTSRATPGVGYQYADDQTSRATPGVGYQYELTSPRAPLSSRALVGGVEYDSFFVNPLAEGSHDGGVTIDYAGATLGVGIGHNNPLAAEYFDRSSTASPSAPSSPAQTKIRVMTPRSGEGCDAACPAAPGTPLQARMTVKLIGVAIDCDTARCSEDSGSLNLPKDAAQCFGPEEEEEAEETMGGVPPGGEADRRASVEGSGGNAGWASGSHDEAEYGFGAEPPGAPAGQEREGGERGALAVSGLRRTRDACSEAAVSRSDSFHSLGSSQTTPVSSPRRPDIKNDSSGGASSACSTGGGGCGPCGTVRVPSTPEQSPASALLRPQTPLSDVEPIGRRVASETDSLAEQHESDIEEGADGLDSTAAAGVGGGSSGGGVAEDAAFAPCTPPLAAREGTSGGSIGGVPSQGGRESRSQNQAADGDRAAKSGGGAAASAAPSPLADDVMSELRSALSALSPPQMALEATEGWCYLEATLLLQVRSVPTKGAAPLPPSTTVQRPACGQHPFVAKGLAEAATAQASESPDEEEQEEEQEGVQWPPEMPATPEPPAAAAQLLPGPLPPSGPLSAGGGQPAAEAAAAAASEVEPEAADSTRPRGDTVVGGDPPVTGLALLHPPASSLEQGRTSPDLRKAFNSCGGGGGRNSTCSSCEIPSAPPPPTSSTAPACLPPSAPRRGRGAPGDSIPGLTMTRLLIRQLGLVQTPRSTVDDLPTSPSAPSSLGRGCAAAVNDAPAPSPFAAAVDAATAAIAPAVAPAVQAAAPPGVLPIQYGKSHEAASVTFALELPCRQGTTAAPAPPTLPGADAAVGVAEPEVGEAAVGGFGAAEDDGLSSSLTRESSSLSEERSSYSGLYGIVSSRSLQGWLEPQGWKPLRERYGGGVQQH